MNETEFKITRAVSGIELNDAFVGPARVIGRHLQDMLIKLEGASGCKDFRTLEIGVDPARPSGRPGLCLSASVVTGEP